MNDKQLKAVAMPGDFIFHSSWFEIFKSFDMATAYAIFMAMIAYVQTGEIPADEELRRLTVFRFAHIDTDRQRILSLQPKRRTTAKKKTATETPTPEPEPQSNTEHPDDTADPQPAPPAMPQPSTTPSPDLSDTSVISDISVISKTSPVLSAPQDAARRAHYAMRLALASAKAKHSQKSKKGGKRR